VRPGRACRGYVWDIQGDRKSRHTNQLDGGGRSPAKPVSREPNSLFIREIARYLLILEQLEDRTAAENLTKRRLWKWSRSEWNSEFISTIQGNVRGEQGA
jgi:hypothetical protein